MGGTNLIVRKRERKMDNYIKLEDCKDEYLYRIEARNGYYGIYKKDDKGFIIRRNKFGSIFTFLEYHWDTGPPYGTVHPTKEIEKSPFSWNENDIPQNKIIKYIEKFELPTIEEENKKWEEYQKKINKNNA